MPISALPRNSTCVDPIALECKIVIDASGHDSVAVKRMMDRGYVKWKGMDPMWVEGGEDSVVNYTDEVFPDLIAVGMSVTETNGLSRMGPTFGSMLLSGKKGAEVAMISGPLIRNDKAEELNSLQSQRTMVWRFAVIYETLMAISSRLDKQRVG
jgi:Thi4 family